MTKKRQLARGSCFVVRHLVVGADTRVRPYWFVVRSTWYVVTVKRRPAERNSWQLEGGDRVGDSFGMDPGSRPGQSPRPGNRY